MNTNTLIFCSSIPRSGSTLLLCLLGQNPDVHVTPTNALGELLFGEAGVRDQWRAKTAFQSQGLSQIAPRIKDAMRGLMAGFYRWEMTYGGRTVIDKDRIWLGHIDLLEEILEREVRIIVPVRAVEDVLASFERLHRRHALTGLPHPEPLYSMRLTAVGRAQSHLAPAADLGKTIARLRDAIERGYRDRLLIVPYRELTEWPVRIADRITKELGLSPFDYDSDNVRQLTHENDDAYGMELHQIREGQIELTPTSPWRGLLREDFVEWVRKEYEDINDLARTRPCPKEVADGLSTADHR